MIPGGMEIVDARHSRLFQESPYLNGPIRLQPLTCQEPPGMTDCWEPSSQSRL
ncbi:MAG: hypothetical protein HC920_14325 [Oscillatoriales cyanobacterium SM2_3_0]|nr:hypothetical protein [Oscillatoriales cyanobacterium SM2_3_0]